MSACSNRIRLFASWAFLIVPSLLIAQAGSLDPTFGSGGIATKPGTTAAAAALQSDGKIVVVGANSGSSPTILRYNINGELDSTFGSGGQVTITANDSGSAFAVAIQSDGKILVAAPDELKLAVFRLNANGSMDTSFGTKGVATVSSGIFLAPANGAIALEASDKILVVASSQSLAAQAFGRLLSDGTADSSFGTNGNAPLVTSGQTLVLQPDGRILVLPGLFTQGAVCRYSPTGDLDTTFGGAGQAAGFGTPGGIAVIASNSKFIVAGTLVTAPGTQSSTSGFLVVQYKANGNLDTTFGKNGVVTTPFPGNLTSAAGAVALQSNGGIVAAGSTAANSSNSSLSDFALARYTSGGILDSSFGTNGLVTTTIGSEGAAINTLLIQSDSKILAFGNSSQGTTIARYLSQ